ncbi:MAG: dicarboxylate/amino acid:cation symporter [Proteobacteria bacterium]|nr:dicarboxylate/amino acid:cation symporter [Pseudomonadota bacterium]
MSPQQLPSAIRERLPAGVPTSLTGLIGLALLIGTPLGLAAHASDALLSLLAPIIFFGDLFIACLKLLIVPIIVTSLVVGVANVGDVSRLGKLGGRAAAYYMGTTAIAATLGLVLVNLIRPGDGASLEGYDIPAKAEAGRDMGVGDMLMKVFGNTLLHPIDSLREGDIITVITVTLLFGLGLILIGERVAPVVDGFKRLERIIMGVVHNIMWLAPIGVVGLLIEALGKSGLGLLLDLGKYCLTVLLALGIHGFIILPLIVLLIGKRKPLEWFRGIRPAMAVAFSTSSSAATLPVTIQSVEENLDVPTPVASFVLPLGATMNMDGTALYEAIAALFVAQALGFDLGMGQQLVVLITAMAASVGAAGIPSAGIVTMVMVFQSVGLPLEPLGAIYAVDRVLDMCRTVVNVMGDTAGAVVLTHLEDSAPATA